MSSEHDSGLRVDEPLEQSLRPALDEAAVARVWRGIRAQRAGEQRGAVQSDARWRTRWAVVGVGSLAAAAALVALAWVTGDARSTPGALRVAAHDTALATVLRPSREPIALDDGSQIVVSAAAEMEVLANDGARFVTLLRRGRCHVAVMPGGPRRWTIETDLATVEVVGTEFTVDRSARGLEVAVDHGVVLVRGEHVPGRVTRLRAGERLVVPAVDAQPMTPTASRADVRGTPALTTAPIAIAAPPDGVPARARALAVLPPVVSTASASASAPASAPASASASDPDAQLLAADAARAAGRTDEAARVLAEIMRDSADDPRGALAAFSLAKLQLDELGQPDRAAETFAWVVRRGSPRALVEDAQARRVEALARAGRMTEATAEARVYEARWPEGRRLAEVRALVSE